ncbi:MAG TPA: sensor histidine kinase [Clostridiaceae bacterium]|nr:sensor histidine kinase [Clostridiaceae bacterium]
MRKPKPKPFFSRSLMRTNMLLLSLLLVSGMLIAMFPFTYQLTKQLLRDSQTRQSRRLLEQTGQGIEFYLESMLETAEYLAATPETVRYLAGDDSAGAEVRRRLQVIAATRADYYHLVLLSTDGTLLTSRETVRQNPYRDFRREDWYSRAIEAGGEPIFTSSRVENLFFGDYPWVITTVKAIYDDGRLVGMLLIDLNYERIESILQATRQDDNRGYVFIVGSDGRLVYHPQQQLIYSGIKTERLDLAEEGAPDLPVMAGDAMYLSAHSDLSGWTMVSVQNTAALVSIPDAWILIYVLVGLAFFALAAILSWYFANRLTRPLQSLQTSMKRFEQGDLNTLADTNATLEIADLGESFNRMTMRIRDLLAESAATEEQKRQSELLALQAQIRPHFLYNTLESIIWMAEIGENENVVAMTSALSKLLRAQIAGGAEVVRLDEEIAYTNHYLTIQSLRYGERLDYDLVLEPGLEGIGVLRLVLQPLVENAIYHGIRHKTGKGLVRIEARSDGDHLVIEVWDNGVGFKNPDNWRHVNMNPDGGIGLKNVEDRILLFFGQQYRLEIESRTRTADDPETMLTTVVRIRHPKVTP